MLDELGIKPARILNALVIIDPSLAWSALFLIL